MAADASTPALTRITSRRPSLISIIGLALVGLLVFWLVVNFIKAPSYFVEVFFIGLATGCIYALVALGYTLVYGILELINFANGDVFMLGGMISATMVISVFNLHAHEAGGTLAIAVICSLLVAMGGWGLIDATVA